MAEANLLRENAEHAITIAEQAGLIVDLEEKLIQAQTTILHGLEHKRLLGIEKAANSEMTYKVSVSGLLLDALLLSVPF